MNMALHTMAVGVTGRSALAEREPVTDDINSGLTSARLVTASVDRVSINCHWSFLFYSNRCFFVERVSLMWHKLWVVKPIRKYQARPRDGIAQMNYYRPLGRTMTCCSVRKSGGPEHGSLKRHNFGTIRHTAFDAKTLKSLVMIGGRLSTRAIGARLAATSRTQQIIFKVSTSQQLSSTLHSQLIVAMNTARLFRMQPLRAAAMRQPAVRQAALRQARPFHNSRMMFRAKVCDGVLHDRSTLAYHNYRRKNTAVRIDEITRLNKNEASDRV
jgi:hypothetical protein